MDSVSSIADLVHNFEKLSKQKDETAKFVSLFLLLQILERDQNAATQCWAYISPTFLDKLILATPSKSTSEEEAEQLQTLGCSIMQAYMADPVVKRTPAYQRRSDSMMRAIIRGELIDRMSLTTGSLLHTIANSQEGGITVISNPIFPAFVQSVLDRRWTDGFPVLGITLFWAMRAESSVADMFQDKITSTFSQLTSRLQDSDRKFVSHLLKALRVATSSSTPSTLKLYLDKDHMAQIKPALMKSLRETSNSEELADVYVLVMTLHEILGTFFISGEMDEQDKQFLLLLVGLSATGIRASLAIIAAMPRDEEYTKAAAKVSVHYEVIHVLLLSLVSTTTPNLTGDELLSLRDQISPVFTETISYIHEVWSRSCFCRASPDWKGYYVDAEVRAFLIDDLMMASTQALAVWIQEEESSRHEAVPLMETLLTLVRMSKYIHSTYHQWLIPTIVALLEQPKALQIFNEHGGKKVLEMY